MRASLFPGLQEPCGVCCQLPQRLKAFAWGALGELRSVFHRFRGVVHGSSLSWPRASRFCMSCNWSRLRPLALLRRYPQPWWDVTPTATTASLPRCQHGSSADLPLRELAPVPAWLMAQVWCCRRCPLVPWTWRTTCGTHRCGGKASAVPALPYSPCRLRDRTSVLRGSCFMPRPRSHLLREVYGDRVSQVRQFSFTLAASVTWASWGYGSPAPLARVPPERDLMPATKGYPDRFGWVRTRLPYQT